VGDQHAETDRALELGHMEEAPSDAVPATALSDELRVFVSAEEATSKPPAASRAPIAEEERPHLTEAVAEALAVSDELRSFAVDGAAEPACAPPEGAPPEGLAN